MIVKNSNEALQTGSTEFDTTCYSESLRAVRQNLQYDLEELTLGLLRYTDNLTEDFFLITSLLPGTFAANLTRRALQHHVPYGFLMPEHVVDVMLVITIVLRELDRKLRLLGIEV